MIHFNFLRQISDKKETISLEEIKNIDEYNKIRGQLFEIYKTKCMNNKIYTNECKLVYNLLFGLYENDQQWRTT